MTTTKEIHQTTLSASKAACVAVFLLCALEAGSARADYDFWAGRPGVSATTNWTDAANWANGTNAVQTYYNEVEFTGVGANTNTSVAVNNVLDNTTGVAQMPIWELDYVATNGNYTTLIAPGVTMTLGAGRGFLEVGADQLNTGTPAPANAFETMTITGPGAALSMAGNLYVNQGSPTAGDTHNITLDMSGLDNFSDNGGNNEILVASGGAARTHGTFYLAKTNQISLGNDFQICNQAFSNSLPCAVYLGQANTILTGSGNLIVAGSGTSTVGAWMKFNPAFLGGDNQPTAYLGGTGSDGRIVNFWICNANGGPQIPGSGLCDFTGGNVTVLAETMQLGQAGSPGANAQGVLTADDGVINANNAFVGNQEVSGGGIAVGIVNLNTNATFGTNATLVVNNTLTLAAVSGTVTAGTAGTININGGALSANNIVSGGGTAAINVTNGTLTVTGTAGTPAAPLTSLVLVGSAANLTVARNSTNTVSASVTTGGVKNTVNIVSVPPSPTYPVQYPLIKYSGSIGGAGYNFSLGTLPPLCAGFLSNNTAKASVDLVLTAGPSVLTWTGSVSGDWDTTTKNWQAGGATTYPDGGFVQFLDGAATGAVNLTTTLSPGGVTVSNNTLGYSYTGGGALAGSGALVKAGTGTLVIDNSSPNTFGGGVTIAGGTLQVGNNDTGGSLPGAILDSGTLAYDRTDNINVGNAITGTGGLTDQGNNATMTVSGANSFTGPVLAENSSLLILGSSTAFGSGGSPATIANGSTLDANGFTATKAIVVSGTGQSGSGALINNGGAIYDNPGPGLSTNIMLAGDTTFGYPQRWDLGSAAGGSVLGTTGQPYNLTLNSSIGYFEWNNLTVQPPLSNIIVQAGNLGVVGSTTFGDPNATLVLEAFAGTTFWGPSVYVHKGVDFQDGATIQNASGANVMNGAMTLEAGLCTFNVGFGTTLTVSNVLSGTGTFYDIGGAGTAVLAGNSPSYTGTVLVYNGQLTLNGSVGGPVTTQSGTTLAGSGSAAGLVDVSGAFVPGGAGTAGTFTAGGLTLESGATLTMDLGPTTTVGSGANDLITVNGNLTVNGNNISINPLTGTLASGTYTLFTYTGSLSGTFGMASTVASSRYTFTLDTNVAHQVRLIVSGVANLLEWNNGANNGQWDVQSSLNWSNLTSHAEDQFFTSDAVLLDDSITNAAHPNTSIVIGSGQVVAPSALTNNSTTNYTISGSGKISGGGSIVKLGTSTLNLSTTNDFTGNVTVRAGTLQINGQLQGSLSPVGAAAGTLFVTNGATLIVNLTGGYPSGDIGFAAKPLVVSGSGANGLGVIQNNGNPIYNDGNTLTGLGQSVTLTGNTTIGGTARWDWGYPGLSAVLSTGGSNYNFTAIQSGYAQWMELTIDTNLGNFDYISTASTPQTWQVAGMGGSLGNPTNTLTVHSNVLMYVVHGNTTAGDSGYAKVIHLLPTVEFRFQPSGGAGDYRLATSFVLESNATISFYSGTGGSGSGTVVNGAVKLNGLAHFQTGDAPLTFSNVISGAGGFFWDNYNNNMIFTAANTYQGITDIRSGRDLVLVGGGSISGSTNISLAASATLDVSGRTDKTLTLVAGQTLQGSGTVDGNLVVSSSATVSTGTASAIGTLTVTNAVTLSGTTVMKLNKTGSTADEISGASSIHYGGTLSLSNIGGTLAAGDSFTLFSAGSYAGSFTAITPSTPGAGLAWDTSGLSSGKIAIKAASVPPTIGAITVSAGRVVISGRNNTGLGGGSYHVLSSANVGASLSSWTVLTNGTFDSSGNFSSTNAVGTNAVEFYTIREP